MKTKQHTTLLENKLRPLIGKLIKEAISYNMTWK